MGLGAIAGIAGAVGGLASAGVGIAGALSGPSPQGQAGQFQGQLKALANMYLSPYMNQNYWAMDIPGMAQQSINFGLQNVGGINQANLQQLQSMLNQALPGYQGMVNQAATNTGQLLAGQIPADVQNQLLRSSAFQSLRGGFAGTGASGALTARDLGLTSLQLQGQGQQQMGNLLTLAKNYLTPQLQNPLSLLPLQDLISGNQWSKVQQYNATQNYVNMRAQGFAAQYGAPYQSNLGALGAGINTGIGALTATNPQTGQSGLSSLVSLLGGQGVNLGGSTGSSALSGIDYLTGASGGASTSDIINALGTYWGG